MKNARLEPSKHQNPIRPQLKPQDFEPQCLEVVGPNERVVGGGRHFKPNKENPSTNIL